MSRAAATRNEQAAVDRYLLPREVRVATVRRHPAMLIAPTTEALGVMLVTLLISFGLDEGRPVRIAVWLIATAVILGLLYIMANWFATYYVITSERILIIVGSRSVKMTPLNDVTDLEITRSQLGRILKYGTFKSKSGSLILDHVLILSSFTWSYAEESLRAIRDKTTGPGASPEYRSSTRSTSSYSNPTPICRSRTSDPSCSRRIAGVSVSAYRLGRYASRSPGDQQPQRAPIRRSAPRAL